MSKSITSIVAVLAASLMLVSCGDPGAANTAANKPANAANNAAAPTTPANHEAEVKKVMADLAAALAKNDAEAASRFYADDYHLITPQGVDQNKTTRMADMRSGSTKFDTFAYENISVRSYGDMAVAIADVKATGKAAGQNVASNIKATLVFHKTKDGLKIVSGQATPVTAAPAAASPSTANTNAASNR